MNRDLAEMTDNELLDTLDRLRRDFIAADRHRAWAIWQRVAHLAAESERRLLVRDCEEYLRLSSTMRINSGSGQPG
jgi:hypothetical protein